MCPDRYARLDRFVQRLQVCLHVSDALLVTHPSVLSGGRVVGAAVLRDLDREVARDLANSQENVVETLRMDVPANVRLLACARHGGPVRPHIHAWDAAAAWCMRDPVAR